MVAALKYDYHLEIVKAICYSAIHQKEKAIELFENQLSNKNHSTGFMIITN